MKVTLIAAAAGKRRVIGNKGKLIWRLPNDMKFFKDATMDHPVVMGRKTWESLKKPLEGRLNIVLTRDKNYKAEGAVVVHSVAGALLEAGNYNFFDTNHDSQEVFIIGGSEIYRLFLPIAHEIYYTYIDHEFEGDAFFPLLGDRWASGMTIPGIKDEKNPYDYEFRFYERV